MPVGHWALAGPEAEGMGVAVGAEEKPPALKPLLRSGCKRHSPRVRLTAARESPSCGGRFKTAFAFMSRQRGFPRHWSHSFHAVPCAAGQEPTWLHLQDMGTQPLAAGVGHALCWVYLGMKHLEDLPPPAAV